MGSSGRRGPSRAEARACGGRAQGAAAPSAQCTLCARRPRGLFFSRPAGRRPLDPEELLREAEEAAGEGALQFVDSKGLKRLVLALERKVSGAAAGLDEVG